MNKILLTLDKIGDIKISLMMYIKTAKDIQNSKFYQQPTIYSTINNNGESVIKFSPVPFINIDINTKAEEWSNVMTFSFTEKYVPILVNQLETMLKGLQVKDLFYSQNSKLYIRNDIAKKYQTVTNINGKHIIMIHTVVTFPEDEENNIIKEYEGIALFINDISNYVKLTISQIESLIYLLKHTDMKSLSMQLLNSYIIINGINKSN